MGQESAELKKWSRTGSFDGNLKSSGVQVPEVMTRSFTTCAGIRRCRYRLPSSECSLRVAPGFVFRVRPLGRDWRAGAHAKMVKATSPVHAARVSATVNHCVVEPGESAQLRTTTHRRAVAALAWAELGRGEAAYSRICGGVVASCGAVVFADSGDAFILRGRTRLRPHLSGIPAVQRRTGAVRAR